MSFKNNIKNNIINQAKDKNRTMRLNHFLANNYIIAGLLITFDIILFFLLNYIVNSFSKLQYFFMDMSNPDKYLGLSNMFLNFNLLADSKLSKIIYCISFLCMVVIDVLIIYQIKTSLSEKNFNVGQKGDIRWTTLDEIKQQYKEVEEKDASFPGKGGLIVSRYKNKIYIDDGAVNNLILGITRSGKGEMEVFPSIDIYSRAEIQSSLIVCDPKIELYRSSKKTLEKRGYLVYLLNLEDPLNSMGYNPLALITELWKQKNIPGGELLAQTFAFSIFNPDQSLGDNKFFDDNASSLLAALIIAHITDCLKEDELINEDRYRQYVKKTAAYDALEEDLKDSVAGRYFEWISINENGDSVISNEIEYIPSSEEFNYLYENEKKINMYSIINTFTELARMHIEKTNLTALDLYFSNRPMLDRGKLKYAAIEIAGGQKTKGAIYSNMLSKLTIFTYENVAKMTAESSINLNDFGFGDKPIAVFIGIPDYDRSNHFMATVFIRQLYYVLAKSCGEDSSCKRPVKFICDEFGNIPPIESMENIITVCLGRNISFDLYIQAYSQLDKLYGDNAKTIIGNCGNQVYILTSELTSAEEFSKLIGNETVTDLQRTGSKLGMNKTFMESAVQKPLLDANQLMQLEEGDCVIKRVIKRRDLKGNRIKPTPIYNRDENGTRFKFRYEYLSDTFPDAKTIKLSQENRESRRHINLLERVWDYQRTFEHFEEQEVNITTLNDMDNKKKKVIIEAIYKVFGEDYIIQEELEALPVSIVVSMISENEFIKEYEKKAILNAINDGLNEGAA